MSESSSLTKSYTILGELSVYARNVMLYDGKLALDVVRSWDWNASIFDIYDQIRDMKECDKVALLYTATEYFNDSSTRRLLADLASHLCVELPDEADQIKDMA